MIIVYFLGLAAGLYVLIRSADVLLDESIDLFSYWRLSPFVIGALVVGFGTSLPELGVAVSSALRDSSYLALGTAVGSNVANIALILGVSALMAGSMKQMGHKAEAGFLLLISLLLAAFSADHKLVAWEAASMLLLFLVFLAYSLTKGKGADEVDQSDIPTKPPGWRDILRLVISLTLLLVSAEGIVLMAQKIAGYYSISESFVGLTIIAFGSSMPELVTSGVAIKKNKVSLVYGNIIGSNIMNTLLVVGTAVMISPILSLERSMLTQDMMVVIGLSGLLLLAALLGIWERKKWQKALGVLLVTSYGAYLCLTVVRLL